MPTRHSCWGESCPTAPRASSGSPPCPSSAASGIPCRMPLGLVDGVWLSMWASIQTNPRGPRADRALAAPLQVPIAQLDRKSTRLNSSHLGISYAVFCLKKKNDPLWMQKEKLRENVALDYHLNLEIQYLPNS